MLPWRVAPPNPQPPPEKEPHPDEESEPEEEEVDDTPPRECQTANATPEWVLIRFPTPQFVQLARSILPSASQRTIYAAWDRSRGIGGGGAIQKGAFDAGSVRVQAALGFLFEEPEPITAAGQPSPATPPEPLFRPESASPEPEAPKKLEKRESVMIIDSDEDNEPPRKLFNKGKGRAPSSDLEIEVIASPQKKRRKKASDLNIASGSDSDLEFTPIPPSPRARRPHSPSPFLNAEDRALTAIIAIVPDVLPSYVLDLLRSEEFGGNADLVVNALWSGKEYPKIEVEGKGKKRGKPEEESEKEKRKDYLDIKWRKVPDVLYKQKAVEQLYNDYDLLPANYIKGIFKSNQFLYAPSYIALRAAVKAGEAETISKRRVDKKLKDGEEDVLCPELEVEKNWLRNKILKEREEKKVAKRIKRQEEIDGAAGLLLECGCCFTEYIFEVLVQCDDGHLFCKECAVNNADTQIGLRQYKLPCMSGDGCDAEFTLQEAQRFLPATSIAALQKIKQEKEIDEAGLAGLSKYRRAPVAGYRRNANANHGFLPDNFDHVGYFAAMQAALGAAGGFGGFVGHAGGFGGNHYAPPPAPAPRNRAVVRARAPAPPPPIAGPAYPRHPVPHPPLANYGQGPAPRAAPVHQPTPAEIRARAIAAAEKRLRMAGRED
ncbi:hypothetical protein P7C70_g6400, partial [Phenoliferia sp. Uapishka_3]